MLKIFAVIFALSSMCFSQQNKNLTQGTMVSGEDIIRKARETIGLFSPVTSLRSKINKSVQIKADETAPVRIRGKEITIDDQDEITILSPDKICLIFASKSSLYGGNTTVTSIWNEKKFGQTSETEINGERSVRDTTKGISVEMLNSLLDQTNLKKADIKLIDPKVESIGDVWRLIFPLIFINPFESQTKFEYIGRAQAGEQTANLVETKSPGGHSVQLFFDEKTNFLLLMIEKYNESGKDFENKYYYTDRQKMGGLLIPTKVKVERKVTPTGQSSRTAFEYINIESIEVNPAIKPETFKIK